MIKRDGYNRRAEFETRDDLQGFLVELDLAGGYIIHRIECRKGTYIVHYSKPENADELL